MAEFHLEGIPGTLVTAAEPGEPWNGWGVPNVTDAELLAYVEQVHDRSGLETAAELSSLFEWYYIEMVDGSEERGEDDLILQDGRPISGLMWVVGPYPEED